MIIGGCLRHQCCLRTRCQATEKSAIRKTEIRDSVFPNQGCARGRVSYTNQLDAASMQTWCIVRYNRKCVVK